MKKTTKERKASAMGIRNLVGEDRLAAQILNIGQFGKQAFDSLQHDLGRMLVESIFLLERASVAGPDYHPSEEGLLKWGHQAGSVFIGDQKVKVSKPRLVGPRWRDDFSHLPKTQGARPVFRGAFGEANGGAIRSEI